MPRDVIRLLDHLPVDRIVMRASDPDIVKLSGILRRRMEKLTLGETLTVDFSDVEMTSGAARGLLLHCIEHTRRRRNYHGRGLLLVRLAESLYEIQVMLESEGLTAITRDDSGRLALIGSVEPVIEETYKFVAKREWVVAREVAEHFDLNSVAAATNRLTRLADLGLVWRAGQEPAEGGGVQYRYAALS